MKKKNPEFVIICDTRICKSIENIIKQEWEGVCIFNSFSSQARGVAIFIKKDSTAKVLDKFVDDGGNLLAILIEFQNKRILLEGVYGPNTDSPAFYSDYVFKKIADWRPDFSIFAGDFNLVLDPQKDLKNYQHVNNPLARQELINQMQNYNLVDIWRELHPDEKIYTWRKYNENKMSRLDFFLVSSSLLPFIQNAEICSSFCSDHSSINLEIDFSKFRRGKGFWKFNSSHLKDPAYIEKIKNTIKRVVAQYAIIDNDENFFTNASAQALQEFYSSCTPESLQSYQLKINPQSFLDVLLLEIRRETISFSSMRKRERQFQESLLSQEIESLEKELCEESNDENFKLKNENLQLKKMEFDNLNAYQAQGAFIRARAKYQVDGEKPSKLFCSLEKHNAVQKHIPQLKIVKDEKEIILTEQKSIENEIYRFYKDLFSEKKTEIPEIEQFLSPGISNSCPKLTDHQKQKMEGIIRMDELTQYLKKTKNNVAPGSSGYTNEFFKFFWIDLKVFIIEAINYSYSAGMLSVTQRLGIITLIPKGEKDKMFLKNWRPLTLLNALYKLVSGCIAERIKPVLDNIIQNDQKGFVSGRFIGEAIRTTFDIIQWAKENNKLGIILLIDFEKAYDSLSFAYIKKCLNFFNFGDGLIKWVELLLHNFTAVINHCGNISKKFNIGRGARQGDPIASYIFIICIEILAHKLRADQNIQGFKLTHDLAHTLELYADDCSIFLEPDELNLRSAVKTLSDFFRLSGLKISMSKTKAIWFGSGFDNNNKLCPDLSLDWDSEFTLLGIDFNNNLDNMDRNFDKKIKVIEKLLSCWMHRTLTVYGKITIIKSLALSKLSHLALVLPDLDNKQIKTIERMFFKFIWNDKPDKVSRDHVKLSEKAGGLGMVDIKQFWQSLKFSWIKRLINTKAFWPKILELSIQKLDNSSISIIDFLQLGPNKITFVGKKIKNLFWKQALSGVFPFMQGGIFCHPEKIFNAPLWDNSMISRNNKAIKASTFPGFSHKIKTISDFFKEGSCDLLTKIELETKYQIELNEEDILEMHYIINTTFRNLGINMRNSSSPFPPTQPLLINLANISKKGCSSYSRFLKKKKNLNTPLTAREEKWHSELQTVFSINFWNKTYSLSSEIRFENKIKWLQYQVVRNSLYTNYKVNKFNPHVSPLCTFCSHTENPPKNELVSHIFWECLYINHFWIELAGWLGTLGLQLNMSRNTALFGVHEKCITSIENYLILVSKYYIWKTKFTNKEVSLNLFKKYLFNKLSDLKNALTYANKIEDFSQWNVIYNELSRLPCFEQEVASLPLSQAPAVGTQQAHNPAAGQAQAAGTQPPSQAPTAGPWSPGQDLVGSP